MGPVLSAQALSSCARRITILSTNAPAVLRSGSFKCCDSQGCFLALYRYVPRGITIAVGENRISYPLKYMSKKRRKTARGGQRRPRQGQLAAADVGNSNSARRNAVWRWVALMVVGGGVTGFLLLRHFFPTDADIAELDQVSNQSTEQWVSGAVAARGDE